MIMHMLDGWKDVSSNHSYQELFFLMF